MSLVVTVRTDTPLTGGVSCTRQISASSASICLRVSSSVVAWRVSAMRSLRSWLRIPSRTPSGSSTPGRVFCFSFAVVMILVPLVVVLRVARQFLCSHSRVRRSNHSLVIVDILFHA